jgi:hypothetical protein
MSVSQISLETTDEHRYAQMKTRKCDRQDLQDAQDQIKSEFDVIVV